MKPIVPILAAAAVGAVVVLRPASSPPRIASWTTAAPAVRHGARPPAAPGALVYVAGAVAHPGVYRLESEARVRDAVRLAGGVRADADPVAVNLAAHLRDGDEIVVPVRGADAGTGDAPRQASRRRRSAGYGSRGGSGSSTRYGSRRPRTGVVQDDEASSDAGGRAGAGRGLRRGHRARTVPLDAPPPASRIDLNAADAETLATVPGIGPGLAIRIVAFREANGPFASADELLDVAGITDRRLDAILPYVVAR